MNLKVERQIFSPYSTIGELFIDGVHQAYTLEPVSTEEDIKPRAIPEGIYTLTNRFSPKHDMTVPHVENVPGFDEVEIHPGNFPKDTLACLLVGETRSTDFVGGSKMAFHDLMAVKLVPAWERGEAITITYAKKEKP